MNIDSVENGIVIDHIKAGKSMDIYKFLHLDELDCSVAIIKNARSKKSGKKDIIKIENVTDVNMDVLGFVDPDATVNIIENGRISRKVQLKLPQTLTNVVRCKNPRCITTVETEIPQQFYLANAEKSVYRCAYCDQEYNKK